METVHNRENEMSEVLLFPSLVLYTGTSTEQRPCDLSQTVEGQPFEQTCEGIQAEHPEFALKNTDVRVGTVTESEYRIL